MKSGTGLFVSNCSYYEA